MKHILAVAFLLMSATLVAACPQVSQPGRYSFSYDDNQLWTPQSFSITAGGNYNLANCGVPGGARGYVIAQPDFELTFYNNNRRALDLRVSSGCDTVLLVNDASGRWWFNDDRNGLNPGIRIQGAPSGVYDVWVGTLGSSTCESTVTLETF